ncbi:MAG: hypothetical protein NTY77_08325 [Elusimicrobia bacterium]|nr:hypothetical protein [Elusimicrobiota bacterium]
MTKKLSILALLAALGGSAQAQAPLSEAQFAAQLQGIRIQSASAGQTLAAAVQARAAETPEPQRLIGSVLTAMNDAPGTGELLVTWLREHQAVVEFSGQARGRSAHAWLGAPDERAIPAVYLDPALAQPVSYRYLAVYVAKETAELMLKDFPESAEKRYIAASRMAESFFELGGTRMTMEDIDGHQDAAVAQAIRLWVEHDPSSGVPYLQKQGVPTLAEVRAKQSAESTRLVNLKYAIEQMLTVPNDPNAESLRAELAQSEAALAAAQKTAAAADAAQKEFAEFSIQEKTWLWEHQGTLQ